MEQKRGEGEGEGKERGTRGPEAGINDGRGSRHSFASLPPPWGSLSLPPSPTRSRNAARILFVSTCLCAQHQKLPTNKQSAFRASPLSADWLDPLSLSLPPTTTRPHLSSSLAMRRFFYRIVNRWMGRRRKEEWTGGRIMYRVVPFRSRYI